MPAAAIASVMVVMFAIPETSQKPFHYADRQETIVGLLVGVRTCFIISRMQRVGWANRKLAMGDELADAHTLWRSDMSAAPRAQHPFLAHLISRRNPA